MFASGRPATLAVKRFEGLSAPSHHRDLPHFLPTILARDELPLADVRNRLSQVVADVEQTHARATITRYGHPVEVPIAPDDLASPEKTLDVISNPDALGDIREAQSE